MCTRSFESLSEAQLKSIEKQMLPGALSESGFLVQGDSLMDVYGDDKSYLQKVNITYDQIADVLETIAGKTYRKRKLLYERNPDGNIYDDFLIDGRYKVKVQSYMGAQTCPFQDPEDKNYYGYQYGSADIFVEDTKTGKKIVYNTLLPHMIRHHHFFESPRVSHRVDPEQIIQMFDIQPNVDYAPKYVTEYQWSLGSGSSHLDDHEKECFDKFMKVLAIDTYETPDFTAYIMPGCFLMSTRLYKGDMDACSYEQARRQMIEHDNKSSEEWNTTCSSDSSKSHIYTEDEIATIIRKEMELTKLYHENGTLFHPEDDNVNINMLVIKKNYVPWLDKRDELKFTFKGAKAKVSKYQAYSSGSISKYKYIPVEEDCNTA